MRRYYLFGLTIWIAAAACRQAASKESSVFLPGIYVNQSENEFCRVVDTFIIHRTSLEGDSYLVTRRSSFQRIRKGTKMPAEYQTEQWTAVYEAPVKILRAADTGKQLQYDPGQNKVYNGNAGYEKVE